MLEHDRGTVRQFQLCVSQFIVLLLTLDGSRGRLFRNQRFVLHVVNVCRYLLLFSRLEGCEQLLLGWIDGTLFLVVKVYNHNVAVVLGDQLFHIFVDRFNRNGWNHLLHQLIGVIDRRHGLVGQEITQTFVEELRVLALVFVAVCLVKVTQQVSFISIVFGRGESKFGCTTCFYHRCGERSGKLRGVFGLCKDAERIFCLGENIVVITGSSTHVWTVCLLCCFGIAIVQHVECGSFQITIEDVFNGIFQRIGVCIVLEHHLYIAGALFLILVNNDDRFGSVGYWLVQHRSLVGWVLDTTKEFLNHCLGMINIHVANHNNSLI